MKRIKVLLAAGFVGGFVAVAAAQTLVYDNSSNDQLVRFNPGTVEVGDEIILASGPERMISLFQFQYWGENFSGDEQIRVRFYANDAFYASHGTFIAPGTILYDSGWFPIVATPRQTILLDYATLLAGNSGNPVIVPDSFTWSVQFLNVDSGAGERAGLDVYSPPTVGNNYTSYWENDPLNGWLLKTNQWGIPMDFGAKVYAVVPEPSVLALGLGGGLLFVLLRGRRFQS
ncbi:hypothetical protein G4L39_12655 [Limisphaera ngatamarikiensis]|jgi:hypothetical protein|uniref:PEP-CTERM sorting domain-containing protein n=1 Tax=Limisphaera ngatamarikiensis TaxID=1324935 RepID=A0A6M1RS62_9BACT|nr:hypothetical protein [Limisphaera ngatamarikiensis]NGO40237.1 hypothetical protein [Limisphaera ngatamarikiensis]